MSLAYGTLEGVNIGYSSVTPHGLLALIREQLAQDFPNMKVNFLVMNKAQVQEGLDSGDVHFGLVNIDKGKGMYGKDSTFLGHMEFLPFVKKGGALSGLPEDEALRALRTTRQFVLRHLLTMD
ncbi:transcriptional regulators [Vibrio ishigakensis]|uniref:Transcriptional regulators n=1 Tax=Vibrio ishigakensis TaxID=1481914 RepID=A0A0B8PGC6_9VIBR|nr:transcriptional regulators [Vibrio ishigakensis]